MIPDKLARQCAELHKYLCEQIGHNWRLMTWQDKYAARIKKYGLDACKIAVDGFKFHDWWMKNKAPEAPGIIFRSDKYLELFLTAGEKLPQNSPESRNAGRKEMEKKQQAEETRARIEKDQLIMNARMRVKLAELEDEISDAAYRAFINPLLYVGYDQGVCILYHEQADWVRDHYRVQIERALGVKVKIVDKPEEGASI